MLSCNLVTLSLFCASFEVPGQRYSSHSLAGEVVMHGLVRLSEILQAVITEVQTKECVALVSW